MKRYDIQVAEARVKEGKTSKPKTSKKVPAVDKIEKSKKTKEKKKFDPERSGFWPNFKKCKFRDDLLEMGKVTFEFPDPITEVPDLLERLGIEKETDPYPIDVANRIFPKIAQRSRAWFAARRMSNVAVTPQDQNEKKIIGASSVSSYAGLWTRQVAKFTKGPDCSWGDNNQFREVVKNSEKRFDRLQRTRMKWGELKENDALIAVKMNLPNYRFLLVGSILVPVLPRKYLDLLRKKAQVKRRLEGDTSLVEFEDYVFDDEVANEIVPEPNVVICVSPDFIAYDVATMQYVSGELKCPAPFGVTKKEGRFNFYEKALYPEPPLYYCTQMLSQMVAMYTLTGSEYGVFACMGLAQGLRVWVFKIWWDLWDLQCRVLEWANNKYVLKGDRVPMDDDISPFADCPFYLTYVEMLEKFQKSHIILKDYQHQEDWIEEGFARTFFDDENGGDSRKEMSKEDQDRFRGCSAEAVPRDLDDDTLVQLTLDDM